MERNSKGDMMKNVYFVHIADECEGIAVVAERHSQAKTIVFYHDAYASDYIDLRCQKKPEIDATDMKVGYIIPSVEGLLMGVYATIEGICPICDRERTLYYDEIGERHGCDRCLYGEVRDYIQNATKEGVEG